MTKKKKIYLAHSEKQGIHSDVSDKVNPEHLWKNYLVRLREKTGKDILNANPRKRDNIHYLDIVREGTEQSISFEDAVSYFSDHPDLFFRNQSDSFFHVGKKVKNFESGELRLYFDVKKTYALEVQKN